MPEQGQETDMTGTATVSGWGSLSAGGDSPDVLMAVDVPLVADAGKQNYIFYYIKYVLAQNPAYTKNSAR